MKNRSTQWFLSTAIASGAVGLLMVLALEGLQYADLPLWLHIPLMCGVLGVMSIGAGVAGVAYAEYQVRTVPDKQTGS